MNFSPQSIYKWYQDTLRHPKYRWWIILGTLAYLLSPIDISPDFFPIFGQIDDVMLITLLGTELLRIVSEWVSDRSKKNVPESEKAKTVDVESVSVD